jgi:hypothetical protein
MTTILARSGALLPRIVSLLTVDGCSTGRRGSLLPKMTTILARSGAILLRIVSLLAVDG